MKTIERLNALYIYAKTAKVEEAAFRCFVDILPEELRKIIKSYRELKRENALLMHDKEEMQEELERLRAIVDPKENFASLEGDNIVNFEGDGTIGV